MALREWFPDCVPDARAIRWDVPLARILLITLALTHAVGLADLVFGDACDAACTGDGCDTDCPPGPACRCHGPTTMPLLGSVQSTSKLAPPSSLSPIENDRRAHASPDPREILHVPRHVV